MTAPARLQALDVFRGATVALMIGVNNPGSWAFLYPPLAHANWHGVTPTDLVFPFFLFAVGNALALVMPRWLAGSSALFWRRVLQRTALIFVIGLALNAAPLVRWDAAGELVLRDWPTLRLMGVLQRIALAFGAAAVIVWLCGRGTDPGRTARRVCWAVAALLLGYWALCDWAAAGPDPYSLEGFFGTHVDRALLGAGHLYRGEGVPFDPEGLASTLPALAQVLLGWWAGQVVLGGLGGLGALGGLASSQAGGPVGDATGRIAAPALLRLFSAAVLLGVLAYLWQLQMPLNKKLWTSSYVLLTTALALAVLAVLLWKLPLASGDTAQWAAGIWARRVGRAGRGIVALCEAFGRNALGIFVLAGLVPRVLALWRWPDASGPMADGSPNWVSPLPWLYRTLFADMGRDPRLGSLAYALALLAVYAAIAWALHRKAWYWRV